MLVFADVFGLKAAKLAVKLGADAFKIHSSDTLNIPLLQFLELQNKPILISCGGTKLIEIKFALNQLIKARKEKRIVLMHGFQNFPTKLNDSNLSWISYLESSYSLPIGFMDHLDAEDPMSIILPLLGVAAGAKIIEKHFTLDRTWKGTDQAFSLEPKD